MHLPVSQYVPYPLILQNLSLIWENGDGISPASSWDYLIGPFNLGRTGKILVEKIRIITVEIS